MRLAAVLLSALMACQGVARAQALPGLRLLVVEGDGVINNIQLSSSREPVVQVHDENNQPVAGGSHPIGRLVLVPVAFNDAFRLVNWVKSGGIRRSSIASGPSPRPVRPWQLAQ